MASAFVISANKLSSTVPTELGLLSSFVGGSSSYEGFAMKSNNLCSDMPTEVQALSRGVSGWYVTTGNSIGTVCGWQSYMADSRFPTMDGSTSTTSIDYSSQGLTGTIPEEMKCMKNLAWLTAPRNHLNGTFPQTVMDGLIRLCALLTPHVPARTARCSSSSVGAASSRNPFEDDSDGDEVNPLHGESPAKAAQPWYAANEFDVVLPAAA